MYVQGSTFSNGVPEGYFIYLACKYLLYWFFWSFILIKGNKKKWLFDFYKKKPRQGSLFFKNSKKIPKKKENQYVPNSTST